MLPAKVTVPPVQIVCVEPALAVAATLFVNVTLEFAEQLPLVTAQFKVVEVPAAIPFTMAVLEVGRGIVTPVQPLAQVQRPVPVEGFPAEFGLLANMLNVPLLHCV